ncbi:MAG TPA: NTP transferase domain-containing protein [Chloroflexi bacterium]|nr:NTP transferase domain-containing protein [Chloroflexota bacterium]HPO57228.1 sugar phosphate nucleotidyltransferase [Anaerolineaceae bacterium]
MTKTLKIAVPMAGFGSRMRPHTWSKPKPLIALAGRTVLDYVLEQFRSVPADFNVEYVFIVGPNQLEQVQAYARQQYPDRIIHWVVQEEMRGQSDALHLAREHLTGPMLMSFSDTLIETDLSILASTDLDGIAWVKPVEDPRRFGVAQVDSQGFVTRLVEKPQSMENNLAVVGFYYFSSGERLMQAIEEQKRRQMALKGEYYLVDAINVMLEDGARMQTRTVDIWLDAGIPEALLATNRHLLSKGYDNSAEAARRPGVTIVPPVYVHPSACLENAVVGPHVSVGPDCQLRSVVISDSIIEANTHVENAVLTGSLLGRDVRVQAAPRRLNLGDNAWTAE